MDTPSSSFYTPNTGPSTISKTQRKVLNEEERGKMPKGGQEMP